MQKIKFYNLILLFAIALFLVDFEKVLADDSCDSLIGDAQDQCKALEKKAKVYEDLIKLKNKQQGVLSSQLNNIDNEQKKTLTQIKEAQKQVQTLDQQIESLTVDIKSKEATLDYQKKILTNLMQAYYDYDQQGVLPLVLADGNFSDILNQADYIEQSGTKVTDVLTKIIETRQELINNKDTFKQKRDENDKAKSDLLDKKDNLQATEDQKNNLLIQTQGEEKKYQQMLAHVEEQKSELFDFSAASNIDEVSLSVSSYSKPSSNLASTDWYFSQKDSRWGNTKIGNSNSLMKDWGCAIASVAMVFRKNGSSIDPGKIAKQKVFSGDLINWPSSWDPGIKLISSVAHGNYNKSIIDAQISKGKPVIVHINKTNRKGGHYVVITGKDSKDYIVHDPYFGSNLYLGTSRALVGKLGINSGTALDQMIVYD